jgi:hypothetical protein
MVQDVAGDRLSEPEPLLYMDKALKMMSVVSDKNAKLVMLPEDKVDGQAVVGVKVTIEGQKETSLFFNKQTGLLTKMAYRDRGPAGGQIALHEVILSDYQATNFVTRDEDLLKSHKIAVDGPALLEFLAKRKPQAIDTDRIRKLIRKLGDDAFDVREKAMADLLAMGASAAGPLREAAKDDDAEIRLRVNTLLSKINTGGDGLTAAAIRLVGSKKPDGAAAVLLDFVGLATDEITAREAKSVLFVVAQREGKPDPALVAALEDKDESRRKAATAALSKEGFKGIREPGVRLFVTDVKLPMKATLFIDGKKFMESETTEVEFFNKMDDSVFAKPK